MSASIFAILNADDNEVARYARNRTLTHAGFDVIDAASGAEVLEVMQKMRPPLVLLDVKLPDVSGIEVCQLIKKRWPTTIVLQTSATFVSAADRTRGLEGGADTYLIEPIDPDELVATVRALVRLQAAEETTRLLNATLERKIDERTRDLHRANIKLVEQMAQRERAENSLLQAQKMEAVGQLTGSMVHDFNNILASMTGYIQLARRLSPETEVRSLLDSSLAAAERGRRLTARLLAFARREELPTMSVDVRVLVLGMSEWMKQTVGKSIDVEIHAPAGQCVAQTDSSQLELAILNLVLNARDALPAGGSVSITVRMQRLDEGDGELEPGEYVVLAVSDNGTGMVPEVAAHAFDPFFTTKPSGRGTGLGLAQVYNLARHSRGTARITSAEREGTTVEIWLAAGQPEQVRVRADESEATPAGRGEYILLVDDEHDIRRPLARLLSESGYSVETAASGADALASVARRQPDLLLLDYAMPGMTGLDLAKTVREKHPHQAILFMSGFADTTALELEMPTARLLRKPFLNEELFGAIRNALRGPR
ncbi:MAG TPA: response regulator [Burkholderiaceae bacterium]|nr:response regulator [Burkholderiaceae bacterium]